MAKLPGLAEQTVAIGASSTQSAPFNVNTRFVRLCADVACAVAFGRNPTASAANMLIASNIPEYFEVSGTPPPRSIAVIAAGGSGTTAFPGQSGNPVGFAATPATRPAAFTTLNGQTWPGAFSALTAWPGGTGNQSITDGTHATSGAGTSGNPYIFAFYDFNLGTGGLAVSAANCIFVGCRFQSNDSNNYNVHVGGSNINFIYCSFTPLASKWTSPPNGAWPSAGAGLGTVGTSGGYTNTGGFCVPSTDSYQFGIDMTGTAGPSVADHCDCWGHGNCCHNLNSATLGAVTISNCWIHDNCNGNVTPPGGSTNYHQDAIFNGGNNTSNSHVTISNCTIASIGNTNGIALQAAATPYSFITVTGCYLSGYGNLMDIGHNTTGNNNMTVTNNIFGTDNPWVFAPLYADFSAQFAIGNANNNIWSGNKLKVLAGTSPAAGATFTWTSGNDGNFLLPNVTLSTSDWH